MDRRNQWKEIIRLIMAGDDEADCWIFDAHLSVKFTENIGGWKTNPSGS
jgi:hypothetical protein